MIGTRLLFHSLIAEAELVLSGAGSIMEHPTENDDEDKVSVWRTDVHRQWIMRLPGAVEHRIQQWQYGAKGVKPTTLRALNLSDPCIMARVLANEIDPLLVKPTVLLAGRSADGSFRTAAAKEYPSNLCRALVLSVMYSLQQRLQTAGQKLGEDLTADEMDWVNFLAMDMVYLVGSEGQEFFFTSDKYLDQAKMYKFTVPIFGPKVLYDVDYSTRTCQLRFIRERLTDSYIRSYTSTLEEEVVQFFDDPWPS
eukprot:s136_g7.t1